MKWITWREKLQVLEECWSLVMAAFQQGFHRTIALTKCTFYFTVSILWQSHQLTFCCAVFAEEQCFKDPFAVAEGRLLTEITAMFRLNHATAWLMLCLSFAGESLQLLEERKWWNATHVDVHEMCQHRGAKMIETINTIQTNQSFLASASSSVPNSWPNLPCKTDCLRCLMDLSQINYYKGRSYKKYCYKNL